MLNLNRNTIIISSIILLIWLCFAAFFSAERLYGDSAFYLFQLVNDTRFVIEHDRPSSVFMQVIPYMLTVSNASLSQIILWFSLNEWLYYAIAFLFLAFVLKDKNAALGFLFALIIGIRYNYFNPVSELILSTPLIFITFSLLSKNLNVLKLVLIFLLFIVIVYSHPLNILVCGLLFFFLPLDHFRKYKNLIITLFIMFIGIVIYKFLDFDEYEVNSVQGKSGKSISEIYDVLSKYNYARFIFRVIPGYLGLICLIVWIVIKRKTIVSFYNYLFFIFFITGFFVLVLYKYGHLFPDTYEPFERYLFIIPVVTCLMFFYKIYPHINPRISFIILMCITIYHGGALYVYSQKVDDRYKQFYRTLDYSSTIPYDIIAIRAENYSVRKYGQDWIMANESILLTSRNSNKNSKQVIIREALDDNIFKNLSGSRYLYSPWWDVDLNTLNHNYFNLNNAAVQLVNTDTSQRDFPESYFLNINCVIHENESFPQKFKINSKKYILFTIINNSGHPLYSGKRTDGIAFRVQWKNMSDNSLRISGVESPVLADIYSILSQEILFAAPETSGNYSWRVGLHFDNGRFIPLSDFSEPINIYD